ncbi:MAG: 7-cyano-7-deazaguanine synthase, partial [Candidatus Peribacteraceae bacterium]|nr:7-cyano-7-deazaguanine synthase [Candidatus Peribacteraceae bacterium]
MYFNTIIHFEVGTEDEQQEKLLVDMDTGVEYIYLPLQQFELPNKIIPFRNYLFVLLAANYGNRIYIGSTLGDTTRDKDRVFQSLCGSVLNYFGTVKEKMPYEAEQFEVCMPFKDRTKTQIVGEFLSFCDVSRSE